VGRPHLRLSKCSFGLKEQEVIDLMRPEMKTFLSFRTWRAKEFRAEPSTKKLRTLKVDLNAAVKDKINNNKSSRKMPHHFLPIR
jgi:uncharacterized protein (TIGR03643 family)